MATREQSTQEILTTFDKYGHLLDECGIDRPIRLAWVEKIETYKETLLCHAFLMKKLLVRLLIMQDIWKRFPKDVWAAIRIRKIKDTLDLNEAISDVKVCWKNRPQFNKRKYT